MNISRRNFLAGASALAIAGPTMQEPKFVVGFDSGCEGSGAAAIVRFADGVIKSIDIINPGSGYTSLPYLTVNA
jgi:hypothetical protein